MKINKAGILLFTISLFCSLVALELSLRAAGAIFQGSRKNVFSPDTQISTLNQRYFSERDYEHFNNKSKNISGSIWAIGDSYTNAGNVSPLESYPSYLFQMLQTEEYNYSVVNLGQCEDPTWGVYYRLHDILENKLFGDLSPEIVIILTGSSDPFYHLFSNSEPLARDKQELVQFLPEEKPWYRDLRVVKVFRYIQLTLLNKKLSWGANSLSERIIKELALVYDRFYADYQKGILVDGNWEHYREQVKSLLWDHRAFVDGEANEFDLQKKERFVFNTIIVPTVRFYSSRLSHEKALEAIMKFSIDYPQYFWGDPECPLVSLYFMSQIMKFQSKYTASRLSNYLIESTKNYPNLRSTDRYKFAESLFSKLKDNEINVNKQRLESWNNIIELSKQYGFKIVVQNYAPSFTSANNFLKSVSQQYGLPFVDNNTFFKTLLSSHKREALFADDDHFLPKGYEKMAENVFSVLKKKKLIHK